MGSFFSTLIIEKSNPSSVAIFIIGNYSVHCNSTMLVCIKWRPLTIVAVQSHNVVWLRLSWQASNISMLSNLTVYHLNHILYDLPHNAWTFYVNLSIKEPIVIIWIINKYLTRKHTHVHVTWMHEMKIYYYTLWCVQSYCVMAYECKLCCIWNFYYNIVWTFNGLRMLFSHKITSQVCHLHLP